ncbi:SIR2 family protein [Salinibacter ruber]|jgi:hypothetical protein|uniref:SIR2 family protein n=1 Tax=Salinibacter ruber TaxID=146919 RepID=UPI002169D64E|nr:SIR2 family protein [Salinibacter ruber]MCS4038728.1 hypothetical protein [Salinibacter ruber]
MEKQELTEQVQSILDQSRTAPFLFVGTGLSRRYLGAADWESLLQRYARETGESFDVFVSKAERQVDDENNDAELYPLVGSLIDEAFFDVWLESDRYAESRARFGGVPTSPLKYEIASEICELSGQEFPVRHENEPDRHEEELAKLQEATIDGIITTNYDQLLERLFDYEVYVGQSELIFEEQHSIAEIYKIHGSCNQHDTLVLTGSDYDEFNENNPYLAAKLITIFLEHPVVFLGYSIRDQNVRGILRQVIRCLDSERLNQLSNRLIFVEWDEEPNPPEISSREFDIMEGKGTSLEVTRVRTHSFLPIYEALSQTSRQMSAKLMRRMKNQVYQLALTQEPQEQIYAVDIEEAESHDDVEFVMGVGVHERISKVGATGISIDQLFDDLVTDSNRFDHMANAIVTDTIRDWLNTRRKLTPVYRYMDTAGFLDNDSLPKKEEIPGKVVELALQPQSEFQYPGATDEKVEEYRSKTVQEVIEEGRENHLTAAYLTLVNSPDTDALWEFIQENRSLLQEDKGSDYMKRLVCIYDRQQYGPGFDAIDERRERKEE